MFKLALLMVILTSLMTACMSNGYEQSDQNSSEMIANSEFTHTAG